MPAASAAPHIRHSNFAGTHQRCDEPIHQP